MEERTLMLNNLSINIDKPMRNILLLHDLFEKFRNYLLQQLLSSMPYMSPPIVITGTFLNTMKNYKPLKSRLLGCRVIAQETHAIVVAVLKLKYLSFFWNTMWVLLLKKHSFRFCSSELHSVFSIAVWSLYSTIDLVSG